ncbi:MAG: hypothetical protein V4510_12530 [bacterium]
MTDPQTPATEAGVRAMLSSAPISIAAIIAIEAEARAEGVKQALDHERQGRAGTHLYNESCPLCDPDD